ncbi:DUF6473 family protein [Marivita sp. S0852]|uniref:DUF6473 family protein n=1 Tax=Marivita sp. S0852 TaxID=3373893 RepID=UPI003981AD59
MHISSIGDRSIDYAPCRYNGSRLWFRGPRKALRGPYVACLGGCEMYGRYVAEPLSDVLDARVGPSVVNLGVENAGVDAYLNDPGALCTAASAAITVLQLSGCHNTSNRYYSVHPRRNDRFLKASPDLTTLYPEMDFTEVHFTRHMLTRLQEICPARYDKIIAEARRAWHARIVSLIRQLNGKKILLWFAPQDLTDTIRSADHVDPFLSRTLVHDLHTLADGLVEVVPERWALAETDGDICELEAARMERLPGPQAHQTAADALANRIKSLL